MAFLKDVDPASFQRILDGYVANNTFGSYAEALAAASRITVDAPSTTTINATPAPTPVTPEATIVDTYENSLSGVQTLGFIAPPPGLGGAAPQALPFVGGVLALSALLPLLPESARNALLGLLGGAGVVRGATLGKAAILRLATGRFSWLVPILSAVLIGFDSITADIDIPFVPSIPGFPQIGGSSDVPDIPHEFNNGARNFAQQAVNQHGPVVKTWVANGTPFVMFADGWMTAQRANGTWHFWKPKKPVVYVPGGPMSRKTARRMASIYNRERKRAKKDFNLVDSKRAT